MKPPTLSPIPLIHFPRTQYSFFIVYKKVHIIPPNFTRAPISNSQSTILNQKFPHSPIHSAKNECLSHPPDMPLTCKFSHCRTRFGAKKRFVPHSFFIFFDLPIESGARRRYLPSQFIIHQSSFIIFSPQSIIKNPKSKFQTVV